MKAHVLQTVQTSNAFQAFAQTLPSKVKLQKLAFDFLKRSALLHTFKAFDAVREESKFSLCHFFGMGYSEKGGFFPLSWTKGEETFSMIERSDFFHAFLSALSGSLADSWESLLSSYDHESEKFAFKFSRETIREGYRRGNKACRRMAETVETSPMTDEAESFRSFLMDKRAEAVAVKAIEGLKERQAVFLGLVERFPGKAERLASFLNSCQGEVSTWPKNWRRNAVQWQKFVTGKNSPLFRPVRGRKSTVSV